MELKRDNINKGYTIHRSFFNIKNTPLIGLVAYYFVVPLVYPSKRQGATVAQTFLDDLKL